MKKVRNSFKRKLGSLMNATNAIKSYSLVYEYSRDHEPLKILITYNMIRVTNTHANILWVIKILIIGISV